MTKKILITGMNKLQCTRDFYLSQQLQVVPSHYSLIRCLEDMGYLVEQRNVEIGEDLSHYHHVIVFLHNPAGFAAFVYNALWAVFNRQDCILAFDDWQTDSIYSGLLSLTDPEKLFRPYVLDSHTNIPPDIKNYQSQFIEAINLIESKANKVLISAFDGGDLSLVVDYPKDKLFGYNPNPYHFHRKPSFVKKSIITFDDDAKVEKQRIFNFAGLVQDKTKKWLKSQEVEKTGWELKLYGSRKDGQDRVKEHEMVDLFAQHWGILMAGYHHAGSGWWRSRPTQCADAGSVLIGDPREMILLYGDTTLANIKAIDLIDCSDHDLHFLAASQKDALYSLHSLNKHVQQQELLKCLES